MQIIKSIVRHLVFILPLYASSQSVYLQQGSKENILMERLEIKSGGDSILNFNFLKPFNRRWWVRALENINIDSTDIRLSKVDKYNIFRSKLNNLEWVTGDKEIYKSKKDLWNTFYKTPANLVEVDNPDFFLSVNPVLNLSVIGDSRSDEVGFVNSRGIVARMLIAKRIGLYTYLTENQERAPVFVQERINQFRAVPGAGFYKPFKTTGVDYFDGRGYITFNAAKFLDVQFGYDKVFLGSGYRSLYLSDYANSHLFLNLNLRVWKLNYVSKTVQLTAQYKRGSTDSLFPKKYATIHHISYSGPKWLTVGIFEGVVWDRLNDFEFAYLNPIIFLRPMEQNLGSGDNAFVGFDIKTTLFKRLQLYTQVMFDEFKLSEIKKNDGWWANKWAWQMGAKYIDAFGINNLDLQAEMNLVRPFTYAHNDTIANYTHYNQPMAHPLMSNIQEFVAIARYQPWPKWYAQVRMNFWKSGTDTAGVNFGNNIFRDTDTRPMDYGFNFGSAKSQKWMNTNFWLAYELMENFFIEGNLYFRKGSNTDMNTIASFGIRWNMQRREYDY
ncbi:hypothetical protein [Pollutibacter soli]|uniref:hypothetical protein n=1 Tax=Pollutibacter soli TaxID=3034157 RepID=UPI0030138347